MFAEHCQNEPAFDLANTDFCGFFLALPGVWQCRQEVRPKQLPHPGLDQRLCTSHATRRSPGSGACPLVLALPHSSCLCAPPSPQKLTLQADLASGIDFWILLAHISPASVSPKYPYTCLCAPAGGLIQPR